MKKCPQLWREKPWMSSSEKISATKNPLGFPKGWSSGFLFNRCPGRRVTLFALVKTLVALNSRQNIQCDTHKKLRVSRIPPPSQYWTVWNAKEKKHRKNQVTISSSWLMLTPPPQLDPQLANCYLSSRWHAQDHRNCKRPLPCHHRPQESTNKKKNTESSGVNQEGPSSGG